MPPPVSPSALALLSAALKAASRHKSSGGADVTPFSHLIQRTRYKTRDGGSDIDDCHFENDICVFGIAVVLAAVEHFFRFVKALYTSHSRHPTLNSRSTSSSTRAKRQHEILRTSEIAFCSRCGVSAVRAEASGRAMTRMLLYSVHKANVSPARTTGQRKRLRRKTVGGTTITSMLWTRLGTNIIG